MLNGMLQHSEARVGETLRRLRTERRWSMRELGGRLGVSAATISAVENGHTGVTVERLGQFAHVFGIPAPTLLARAAPISVQRADTDQSWRVFDPLDLDPVLSAALDAFVATGYHGSSMRSISARAGISLPGIYHHYPSKQNLLVTILDLTMSELEWRITQSAADIDEPLSSLHRHVEALALFHVMRAGLAFVGASEMRSLDEPNRTRIATRRSRLQHLIDDDIMQAISADRASCPRPLETGRAIATMCTSLPQWFDVDGPTPAHTVAKEYADIAIRMIGGRPSTETTHDSP